MLTLIAHGSYLNEKELPIGSSYDLGQAGVGGLLGNRRRQIDPSSSVSVDDFGKMIMKADHHALSPV
jgi:hypothetical protein